MNLAVVALRESNTNAQYSLLSTAPSHIQGSERKFASLQRWLKGLFMRCNPSYMLVAGKVMYNVLNKCWPKIRFWLQCQHPVVDHRLSEYSCLFALPCNPTILTSLAEESLDYDVNKHSCSTTLMMVHSLAWKQHETSGQCNFETAIHGQGRDAGNWSMTSGSL